VENKILSSVFLRAGTKNDNAISSDKGVAQVEVRKENFQKYREIYSDLPQGKDTIKCRKKFDDPIEQFPEERRR